MREVVLKGDREGLLLIINSEEDFGLVLEKLQAKLEASRDFFEKSPQKIAVRYKGTRGLTLAENQQIKQLLSRYSLIYGQEVEEMSEQELACPQETIAEKASEVPENVVARSALTIYKTIRGGQSVTYNGTIIILGDVNPLAKVMAENDIIVAGVNRGILHAGCLGDRNAKVVAASFNGGQIRIADLIVRAPDEAIEAGSFEVAKVQDEQIVIDSISR